MPSKARAERSALQAGLDPAPSSRFTCRCEPPGRGRSAAKRRQKGSPRVQTLGLILRARRAAKRRESFRPAGAATSTNIKPSADALGYFLTPLRGFTAGYAVVWE